MLEYADKSFYLNEYRCGIDDGIAGDRFPYYSRRATKEIRARTFGNIDESAELPDEVKMCCCEVAEKLYDLDRAKGENGLILQVYSNDGESGTFLTMDMTTDGLSGAIDLIVRSWLLSTGLMFCGCGGRT